MPPSRLGKLSQRIRSRVRGRRETTVSHEAEIATTGLTERVRDEWQQRESVSIEERFGLVALLQTLALDRVAASPTHAGTTRQQVDAQPAREPIRSFDSEFLARRSYAVADLAGASDPVFLELAYRCILKRAPDPTGSQQLMSGMQAGTLNRIDVLHALNASFEGRTSGVMITGLWSQWLWRRAERVPFAGPVIGWLRAMLTMGAMARRLDALEMRVEARHEHQVTLDTARAQADAAVAALADRVRRLQAESRLHVAAASADAREAASRIQRLEESLDLERARVDALHEAIEDARAVGWQVPRH